MQNKNINSILTLFQIVNNVRGRTKLQKLVFILQQLGFNFEEDYIYHYYGPYSADLQLEVDYLVSQGYLAEQQNNSSYFYSLRTKPYNFKVDENLIESQDLVARLSNNDYQFLEVLATIFYLKEYDSPDEENIKAKLSFLKSHLVEHFDSAFETYHSLVS